MSARHLCNWTQTDYDDDDDLQLNKLKGKTMLKLEMHKLENEVTGGEILTTHNRISHNPAE